MSSTKPDYLDGLPELPDRLMKLKELGTFYEQYQTEVLKRFPKGAPETQLRTNKQKRLLEGFHAYLFGSIFGQLFGCREILNVQFQPGGVSSLERMKDSFKKAVDADDDILTQHQEREDILAKLAATKSVGEVFRLYRWMMKDFRKG